MTDAELRTLDAEIHREVMGLSWDERRCRVCGWTIVPEGEEGCWASNCSMRPLPERQADAIPCYSTSIEAAWRVVEKMLMLFDRSGDSFVLSMWVGKGKTVATFESDTGGGLVPISEPTAPLAICLAALKAVRSKP